MATGHHLVYDTDSMTFAVSISQMGTINPPPPPEPTPLASQVDL
jgi:hypothetical protein